MNKQNFPLEAVATYPLPGMVVPGSLQFSPDDKLLTYLYSPDKSLTRQLFAFDLETAVAQPIVSPPGDGNTDANVSSEEVLRRERLRQREFGVTQYAWSGKNGRLLIPLQGGLYVQDGPAGDLRLLVEDDGLPCLDPRFSPDGRWVAYVQNAELYVVSAEGSQPRQITHGARDTGKKHGLAEYIAQEELSRRYGFYWSPDSQQLAFTEVDETHIPIYRILHQGKDEVGTAAQEDHHYPFAGQPNVRLRLGITNLQGDEPVWLDLGENEDIYLARVNWLPDGRLSAQILNRTQTQLDLLVFDTHTGESQLLLRESSDVWINLHHLFRPLKDGRFIWASEHTGFQHLYLVAADGELIRPLTSGKWLVDSIAAVDAKADLVYFTATKESAMESHLYAVSLDGGELRQITTEPGMHTIKIDHSKHRFVDVVQAINRPPQITLRSLADGHLLQTIFDEHDSRIDELPLIQPEIVTLKNRHGVLLYGAVYRPPDQFGNGPFPTIVSVYGGPHSQRVTNSWGLTVDMRAQYLANQGYLVFKLDNQGSARRGLAFEGVIKHKLGEVEVQDQVDGVRWLAEQGLADPSRVGIYGWSYGGYMALMTLVRAGDVFKTAVAGAPVTHWDGYDTGYTERYMGTPQTNPSGYEISSVMHHVSKMEGNLLLVHGLIDENVHFRHTARLINALIRGRKPYELLLFPDERHMSRGLADRIYMEEHILDFFQRTLP
ncbi:MAG: prolyl oligopeptidase family serine peptidase [Chloroflexi bacterium]|nr:prolyl oligopeptidase family serine peptidase [Chloroflexota bacterium]